jgi:hypothetical protein
MIRRAPCLVLASLAMALALPSCGGGTDPGHEEGGGPNKDKTSWGHYRGPGAMWYISDSTLSWKETKWFYSIQSASGGTIVATYDELRSAAAYSHPPADKKTLTLTRSGDSIYECSPATGSSGTITDQPFAIAKIVGAEAEASGTAMQGGFARGLGRPLVAAGNVSLSLQNILNDLDTRTVPADSTGTFDASEFIPGDSYSVSIVGSSGPPSIVTVGEDKADLGIVVEPTGSFTLKCEEYVGETLDYYYPGIAKELRALVIFNGSGDTGWAEWSFWRDGVKLQKHMPGTTANYDTFQLPTEGGYDSNYMSIELPADLVAASDFASGADRLDIAFDLKGILGSTVFWQDRLSVRYYKESFQLGVYGANFVTLITPDLRVHPIRTDYSAWPQNSTVPKMKGRYYIIVMGEGTYSFGPGVSFGPYDPPDPYRTELAGDEPNASRATATRLDFGKTFKGSVGPLDTYDKNLDPVDYLYFDLP